MNLPGESLCSLLLDDAFVYLRKYHRWPDSKRHQPRQFVASNEILPQVGLKLRRTIKSSYALPILHTTKELVGQDKEAKLSLHTKRPTLIIKETATPVELSLDEHSLLKLIAYNADQVCFIEEALQQLLVSRDMDANRQFRVYSEEDVLERRSYFDSMVLYPFNKRMLRYGVQMQCRDGVLSCRYHGNASRIGLLPDDQYSSVLKSVTQLHDTLSKSKMRKIIEHIRHFITPIHSSFVMNLCELPDTYRVSRLMHRVNKKLRPLNVKIVQPSRGYYLLTFLHS